MNESWIACPFKQGGTYRVRRDFAAYRCSFKAGEILIFKSVAWSRYDGMLGFFFGQPGSEGTWAWDIEDDADLEIWKELFEEIPDAA